MNVDASDQLEYYLNSLGELGKVLIDSNEPNSVGKGLLRLTLGTIMSSKGAIFLFDDQTNLVTILASQGLKKTDSFHPPKSIKKELKKVQHQHIDYQPSITWVDGALKENIDELKTKVIVPLFHKNLLIGMLCIGKRFMGKTFSETEIKLLQIIGNHLTKALYNYILIKDVENKERDLNLKLLELETLFDISLAISSVLDIKELSEEILWRSVGILNASKGLMLIPEKNSPILKPSASFNWDEQSFLISSKLEVFKKINKSGKGLIFSKKVKNPLQNKIHEEQIIIAPLKVKSSVLGYMILCNKETRKGIIDFSNTDLDLLSALCNQAAVALDNARLFKDINEAKQFNESILGSIATGVLTINDIGEIDSVNQAALNIIKKSKEELIGNHYMYLFEKDQNIIEMIQLSELENKTKAEINLPFLTASNDSIINLSVSPRTDQNLNTLGSVIALEDITDISKVKNTFKRYVSKQVVDELLGDDTKLKLGGEQREVTILFSDIRGFTSMSEKMKAEEVVKTLNEYFSDMIDIVFKYNGTLDKIIGDELMVVYGAPIANSDDTFRAVSTAIEMQKKIKIINLKRKKTGLFPIQVGIGLNKGLVVSGNIGSRDMMDYTVIGDTVNLGSRLCSFAEADDIIISKSVWQTIQNDFQFKKLTPIKVKGKEKKVEIYKLIDFKSLNI